MATETTFPVRYRVTFRSTVFAERTVYVNGEDCDGFGDVDKDQVARAIKAARIQLMLDYSFMNINEKIVKVERQAHQRAPWREIVSAYRIQPGTPVRVWTSGFTGARYMHVRFGAWRDEKSGRSFMTDKGERMGLYVADDVFEVIPETYVA